MLGEFVGAIYLLNRKLFMERMLIAQLNNHVGEEVTIAGWIHTIRDQGSIKFVLIRDVSGIIQTVVTANETLMRLVESLTLESVIEAVGLVKAERQAPGGMEIAVEEIRVLSLAAPERPIQVVGKADEADLQVRMNWRWLDLRKPEKQLIFKAWTVMEQAFRNYCVRNGYIEIHSPKLMSTPSESGAELFEVAYFDGKAYLAQSPQFYKQMAMAAGFEKTFEVGPIFRANPSFTSRHDTEFTGYDIEISFIESHHDVMAEEERIIVEMLKTIKEKYGETIEKSYGRKVVIPQAPFPKVTMAQAKQILKELGIASDREGDLSPEEERRLGAYMREKEGHEFVFVTEYPKEVRPFYHMRSEADPNLTKSFDLLFNGLEVTTGAQREHRYDVLLRQAKEKNMNLAALHFYLNFFKYGCPPHGGLGFGPSRFLMQVFGITNVREVTYLYRGVKRLEP